MISNLFAFAIVILLIAFLFILSLRSRREIEQATRQQMQMFAELGDDFAECPWQRVVFASSAFLQNHKNRDPFEARGIAVHLPNGLRLLALWPSGERIDKFVQHGDASLKWCGDLWPDGDCSGWFCIGNGDNALYVSADPSVGRAHDRVSADLFRQMAGNCASLEVKPNWFKRTLTSAEVGLSLLWVCLLFELLGVDRHGVSANEVYRMLFGYFNVFGYLTSVFVFGGGAFLAFLLAGASRHRSVRLGMLCAMVAGSGFVSLALYVDSAFAREAERAVVYRLVGDRTLIPLEPGLPKLEFSASDDEDYWAKFPVGYEHTFVFRRGALGIWQHQAITYDTLKGRSSQRMER